MSNDKPREFWLRREITETCPCEDQDCIWDMQPLKDPLPDHIIHVIEYSAYEKLQAELDESREDLRIYREITKDICNDVDNNLKEITAERDQLQAELECTVIQLSLYQARESISKDSKAFHLALSLCQTENDQLRSSLREAVVALEMVRDIPGLGGLDYTSVKKWRIESMQMIDRKTTETLTKLKKDHPWIGEG